MWAKLSPFIYFYWGAVFIFRFDFSMQQTLPAVQTHPTSMSLPNKAALLRQGKAGAAKRGIGSKKDNLQAKKQLKQWEKRGRTDILAVQEGRQVKTRSDEDNSVTTYESIAVKPKNDEGQMLRQEQALLNKLLSRPPYIKLSSSNIIRGDFGHASAILRRPILQGCFYLQIRIKEELIGERAISQAAAVRVGICCAGFNMAFPLGFGESIGYKSCDGSVVRHGERVAQGQPYGPNDVIGVLMNISPPQKHPQAAEIKEGSKLSFFKNGKLMCQFSNLHQIFYCFAVSLFNYSQVQLLEGESVYAMAESARHYYCSLYQSVPYKDLEKDRIFKI